MAPLFFQEYGGGGDDERERVVIVREGREEIAPPPPPIPDWVNQWLDDDRPRFWERMGVKEMLLTFGYNVCGLCFSLTAIAFLLCMLGLGTGNRGLAFTTAAILAVGITFFLVHAVRDFMRARKRAGKSWWS